jgi:hypothetical protein
VRDGLIGEWRKLHNEELNDLYCSTKYCAGDKMWKNETGWACGTYGGRERCAQGVGGGNQRERDHWGDQDVEGKVLSPYNMPRRPRG